MTDHENLLLNTIEDLRDKLKKGDEYSLLRASGLIRQLILDENPLVHIVNKKYKLKILYEVRERNRKVPPKFVVDGVELQSVISVTFAKPGKNEEQYVEYLKLDDFLKYDIINFANQNFTVQDIIKLCAHIYGGVHAGKIKEPKDFFLDWANKTISYADGVQCGVSSIKDIVEIIINALEPLVGEIQMETTAGT